MRYVGQRYQNETVELDGNTYENCTFSHCKLLYFAYERVSFTGCVFTNCDWSFDGPAENMLYFLRDQYHGQGPSGYTVADMIINRLKDGTFPAPSVPSRALVR